MSKTIAVTGASGFLGRYLCPALEQAGYQVLRLGRGAASSPKERQTDYSGPSLCAALEGADAVINLAGARMTRETPPMDLDLFWPSNVTLISNLVSAAKQLGITRIVQASTIAIYAPPSGLPYRENAPSHPINAYALSKEVAEHYLAMLTRGPEVSSISLRFAAIYGFGEKDTPALMKFVKQASNKETLVLSGNPDYRIDQLYVRDAVAACVSALGSDATGAFNIGGGSAWSIGEIAETVNDVFENKGNIRYEAERDVAMPHTVMALDKAKNKLNWQPTYDLRSGLEDFRKTRLAANG